MHCTKPLTKIFMFVTLVSFLACQTTEKKPETFGYPENELPVNTSSDEAMKAYVDGLDLYDKNRGDQARAHFDKALELDPNFVSAQMYRAFTANSAKNFADHRDKFLGMRDKANQAEGLWMDILEADMADDEEKSFDLSLKLVQAYPQSARAVDNLAFAYNGRDEVEKAREHWAKSMELNPAYLPAVSNLGFSYLFTSPKDFQKAEKYMAMVVEKIPKSSRAQIDLGDCYRAQNDLNKALVSYTKAAELDPEDQVAHSKAGHANSFLGNFDAARKNYQDARAASEFGVNSINFEAYTYLYEGDHKKALAFLEEAAANVDGMNIPASNKNGTKMMCTFNCAMIAMHHGDAEHLRNVVELMRPLSVQQGQDIGSDAAIDNQKANMLYWDTIASAAAGDMDEANAKAEKLGAHLSGMSGVNNMRRHHRALAYINWKQGNYDEAHKYAEMLDKDNVYDKYWMAHANKKVGNEDKAMEMFKEIAVNNFNGVGYALVRNEVLKTVEGVQ